MNNLRLHLHALATGLLLSVAWMEWGTGIVLFFAFVPLFFLEQIIIQTETKKTGSQVFYYAAEAFFVWNVITTYWVGNASLFGVIAAVIVNTTFFASLFWLYHQTRKTTTPVIALVAFVCYWTGFEYFYLNAEISWPWLTLGNGFANNIRLVQWYEYTGVLGGTIWVLVSNILIFRILDRKLSNQRIRQHKGEFIALVCIVTLPMLFSWYIFSTYKEKVNPRTIVVLQPNIDPYNEKFDGMSSEEQLSRMLTLASKKTDKNTDYVIAPETALENNIWEEFMEDNESIRRLRVFLQPYSKTCLIMGMSSHRMYIDPDERSYTARYNKNRDFWYDSFNASFQLDSSPYIPIYHKSKLVIGVEKLPYPQYLRFLGSYAINLGGTFGSLGTQEKRDVFVNPKDSTRIGTAICYESIYGEFYSEFVLNGAQLMCIITNDGWWRNTEGYKQHHNYAKLRAIETRRSIARSANTGRSSFINQKGEVLQFTQWWTPDVIKAELNLNDKITFYTKYGDYLGRFSLYAGMFLGLFAFALPIWHKRRTLFHRP